MNRSLIQRVAVMAIIFSLIATGIYLLFFADPYRFRSEPVFEPAKTDLPKTALKERQPIQSTLCRDALPEELLSAYDTIDEYAHYSGSESFWLENITKDEFRAAYEAYTRDHPEVFWLSSDSAFSYYQMDTSLEVELSFSHSGDALEAAKQIFNESLSKAFTYAPDNADDLETEVFINDYLVSHCEYDPDAEMCHSAYGALVGGKAVCDGYAHAFQLLCNKAGIACSVIEGTSDFNEDKDTGHMWNCVQVGGDWYNADVTWNDINKTQFFCERYFYLNIDDKEIKTDHRFSPMYNGNNEGEYNLFVPECKTKKLRYLDICCPVIDDINKDDDMIGALINTARQKDRSCSFVIGDSLPYNDTCNSIINDGYINSWIEGANHYTDNNHQIGMQTKAYTYKNKNVLTVELSYE